MREREGTPPYPRWRGFPNSYLLAENRSRWLERLARKVNAPNASPLAVSGKYVTTRRVAALVLLTVLGFGVACAQSLSSGGELTSEADRSRIAAGKVESEWPLLGPGPIVSYVQQAGERLARAAEELYGSAPYPWRFKVVRDRAVTAFAIGGGRVYVSDGTLYACNDDSEFGAVLAHEMSHQIAGHFRKLQPNARNARSVDHARIGSLSLQIDLAKELEADRLSVHILTQAGEDPHAALRIASRVVEQGNSPDSHMWTEGRILALQKLLADVPRSKQRVSAEFLEAKRHLALH